MAVQLNKHRFLFEFVIRALFPSMCPHGKPKGAQTMATVKVGGCLTVRIG